MTLTPPFSYLRSLPWWCTPSHIRISIRDGASSILKQYWAHLVCVRRSFRFSPGLARQTVDGLHCISVISATESDKRKTKHETSRTAQRSTLRAWIYDFRRIGRNVCTAETSDRLHSRDEDGVNEILGSDIGRTRLPESKRLVEVSAVEERLCWSLHLWPSAERQSRAAVRGTLPSGPAAFVPSPWKHGSSASLQSQQGSALQLQPLIRLLTLCPGDRCPKCPKYPRLQRHPQLSLDKSIS